MWFNVILMLSVTFISSKIYKLLSKGEIYTRQLCQIIGKLKMAHYILKRFLSRKLLDCER